MKGNLPVAALEVDVEEEGKNLTGRDRRHSDRDRSPRGYYGTRNLETHGRGDRRSSRDESPIGGPTEYYRNPTGKRKNSRYDS